MNAVPTTPTALDKTEEVRKLNVEIATLASVKDIAKRDADALQTSVGTLTAKETALKAEISDLEGKVLETIQSATSTTKASVEASREAIKTMETIGELLKALLVRVETEEKKVTDAKTEQQRVHKLIVDENIVLVRKREDLDVYKKRIEKYFAEYLPDQKVVI